MAWAQIREDKIADFNERWGKLDPSVKTGWDHLCRKISPQFLVDVLTVPKWQDQLPRHRLLLRGAFIDGSIDLTNGEIGPEVRIDASRMEGDFILTDSQWNRPLSFLNSTLAGKFSASGMRSTSSVSLSEHEVIEGELNLMSAKIENGRKVYVANGELAVIDAATNTVITTLGICGPNSVGVAVSPDNSKVYVTCTGGSVLAINAATNAVAATIPVSGVPYGVAVTPNGNKVYVTDYNGGVVTAINAVTNSVISTMTVGPPFTFPAAEAVAVNGSKVYVTNQTSDSVAVIDTATETATIPVAGSISVAVSPDGSKLYIPNRGNNVAVVDAATNQVLTTTPSINGGLFGVSVTPDGRKVFVANYAADTATVIDGMTYAIIGTIPVGKSPLAFGNFIQPRATFAGTPGRANCYGRSVAALVGQYRGLNRAAAAFGFSSVRALQNTILSYCEG